MMFPSECLLERRVRMDHHEDLAATKLPLFIFKCKDRKAEGYADSNTLEIYNKRLEEMVIGVRLADYCWFVSINGFQDFVELKDRTVTVWNLLGHDEGWLKVHEFSLEMLWGFEGFGDLPKELTPMYPVLSTKDTDVIYLGLGENCEFRFRFESQFFPTVPCYLLAVDMRNKIVRNCAAIPPEDQDNWFNSLVTCGFSRQYVDGPCDDEGIPMNKRPIPNSPST